MLFLINYYYYSLIIFYLEKTCITKFEVIVKFHVYSYVQHTITIPLF